MKKEAAILEAILFLENEPVDKNFLSNESKLSKNIIDEALKYLNEKYSGEDSGIYLTEIANGYLLVPKAELWPYLKDRYGKQSDNRLSKAAIETLSIIAYSQPITRAEIENIRGVSADGMIKILQAKNLIKEVGRKDVPGKPIQFGTTKEFLKIFKLKTIAELPKLNEVDQEKFELR